MDHQRFARKGDRQWSRRSCAWASVRAHKQTNQAEELSAVCVSSFCLRDVKDDLIVPPELLEEVSSARCSVRHLFDDFGDAATAVDQVKHLFLQRIDDKKQIVEKMRFVQQDTRGAGRKAFYHAGGKGQTDWHIAEIVISIEANLRSIIALDHKTVIRH